MQIESIIWHLVLLDSIFANLGAWFFPNWYKKNFEGFWRILPLTKVWAIIYLALVLWVGWALMRLGIV